MAVLCLFCKRAQDKPSKMQRVGFEPTRIATIAPQAITLTTRSSLLAGFHENHP